MWTIDRTLNAIAVPRPVRIAYLIPESTPHELLDRLIENSLARWGGRRTPIIPTDGSKIDSAYWTFLDHWDADIFYSYSDLSEELQDRLYYSFAPSEIIFHSETNKNGNYTPVFYGNYQFLSSLSVLPVFDRTGQTIGAPLPEIVDNETWDDNIRDFADSFGFVSRSCLAMSVYPHAKRLSVRRESSGRQSHEGETEYFENTDQWIDNIANRATFLTLSRLADVLCPNMQLWSDYQNGWNNHLTVVIGDTINDRLLAWNAQHRYSGLNLHSVPILRLSPNRFQSDIPEWFKTWITKHNYHTLENNSAKRVKLKSCSLTEDELNRIANQINTYIQLSTEHHDSPNVFESTNLNNNSAVWASQNIRVTHIPFRNNEIDLSSSIPLHLDSVKTPLLAQGMWATELNIERIEDHSQSDDRKHKWIFPRRFRLETAIKFRNYASDLYRRGFHIEPPPLRPNKVGNLVMWDCNSWTRPVLIMPLDRDAFYKALNEVPYKSPFMQRKLKEASIEERSRISNFRFYDISISDKGRDLLGVLQLFRSLPETLLYLNNRFWLQEITILLREEPQNKEKYIDQVCKVISDFQNSGGSNDELKRIAKRVLGLAARSISSQKIHTSTFANMFGRLEQLVGGKDRANELKEDLKVSLTHLRNQKFLWQGFHWRCSSCQHENWVELGRLTEISYCEICRRTKSSPVDELYFQLNPFVDHAFAESSSQRPVLWCLNQLASGAESVFGNKESCFSFMPALNLYTTDDPQPWTDIDITANVNGRIYLVEVKKSFSKVDPKLLNRLCELGDKLRPDVVMLAVQETQPEDTEMQNSLNQLRSDLLKFDVRFEVMTPKDQIFTWADTITIALPYAKSMTWTAW